MPKDKKAEIRLEYNNLILQAPVVASEQYETAKKNDKVTVNHWRKTWVGNIRRNKERFGSFSSQGVGKLYGSHEYQPAIVAGAGPSLKGNIGELKDRGSIPLFSCLHNFHFMEDNEAAPDYYLSLDAGPVTIEEVTEGGKRKEEEYWEKSKDRKLLAYIGTHPDLLEKWRGEIYFFNCPIPDVELTKEIDEIEIFRTDFSTGGNVLGACVYAAKSICGANPIAFTGADFCFGYDQKFHAWDSKYDASMGTVIRTVDVFGNKVLTWPSYHGFKNFFEWLTQTVPGIYFNCTEGGTLGAFPEGNLACVRPLDLCDFIRMYHLHHELKEQCETPDKAIRKILY